MRDLPRRLLAAGLCLALAACGEKDGPAAAPPAAVGEPVPADAGDAAFVQRLMPLLWGRHPASSREVLALVAAMESRGREALVRAMARAPEFVDRWELVVRDLLLLSRLGFGANPQCYGARSQATDRPDIAAFVRDNAPRSAAYEGGFTMRDLIRSALVLDDLSPVFEAHLIANLKRALDDMNLLSAQSQRRNRAEIFEIAFLGRRMPCLSCHNGEFAVTDDPDPERDRHWPLPGYLEKAIYGVSSGLGNVEPLTGFFRRKGVLARYRYNVFDAAEFDRILALPTVRPWGWDVTCGDFVPPDAVLPDDALTGEGEPLSSFFVTDHGATGSIWDLESLLRAGFAELRQQGMSRAPDVSGPRAFATLVAANLADRLWAAALGQRLTAAHGFPRNPFQREILGTLTERFVDGHFSLVAALVAIALHPYFNGAMPAAGADYRPVFDPFVADQIPPAERRNSVGHTLRRMPARMLLGAAAAALGWPQPPEFLLYYMSPDARLQRSLGTFLKPSDPGFNGVSFQSALAWEEHLGLCQDLAQAPACPLLPILENEQAALGTTCDLCRSKDAACGWDPRCCQVDWDAYCSDECAEADPENSEFAGWPPLDPPAGADWLARLLASAGGLTYRAAVLALKDRLLASPLIEADEVAPLEALLGRPLDAPVAADPDAGERARRVCGALLQTPQFLLLGGPGASMAELLAGADVPFAPSVADFCAAIAPLFEPPLTCP